MKFPLTSNQLGYFTSKVKFLHYDVKYLIYGVTGGFYFSSIFDSQTRRIWYGNATFQVCFYVGLEILNVRSMFMDDNGYADMSAAIFLHGFTAALSMQALMACIDYYFREDIECGLKLNENQPEHRNYCKGRTDSKAIDKLKLYTVIIANSLHAAILVGHVTMALYSAADAEELREPKWQFWPNPWAAFIETEIEFVGLQIFLFIPYLFSMFSGLSHALLTLTLAQEYLWSVAPLWSSMERFSEESRIAFKNLQGRYLNADIQLSDYLSQLEIERERLLRNIKSAVRGYQQKIEQIRRILPFLKVTLAAKIACNFFSFIVMITTLYSDAFPLVQKWKALGCLLSIYCSWYCDCYTGEIFSNLAETTLEKVQDIPWYYLDPTRRKVYYIFLCMAQKPMGITALGLCQAGMPICMTLMKMSYTYYNFLRSI